MNAVNTKVKDFIADQMFIAKLRQALLSVNPAPNNGHCPIFRGHYWVFTVFID